MLTKIKALLLKAVEFFRGAEASTESEKMDTGIGLWERMYEDNPPWEDGKNIFSLGLPKTICEYLSSLVLNEVEISVVGDSARAEFLDEMIRLHVLPQLDEMLEKGMAVGGLIMKPYMQDNQVMVDFCRQGEFRALGFDKDRNLNDVEFYDFYVENNTTYSRVERQITGAETVEAQNKTFLSKGTNTDLGREIDIKNTNWSDITPYVVLNNTPRTGLFGYYRVAKANNQDTYSALGMSVYGNAVKMIERTDRQFSRLDWEYDAGQMAVDVAEDAVSPETFERPHNPTVMDETRQRLYRKLDLNSDATYEVFAPTLRDANYISGLDRYLSIVEDKVGIARGTLAYLVFDARTATEIISTKKRTIDTVHKNQRNLEKALRDLVDAMNYYAEFYELTPSGDYSVVINWNDSILEDEQTMLNRELQLVDAGIKSKPEVRMFITGEDEETATEKINEISSSEDLFAGLEVND